LECCFQLDDVGVVELREDLLLSDDMRGLVVLDDVGLVEALYRHELLINQVVSKVDGPVGTLARLGDDLVLLEGSFALDLFH